MRHLNNERRERRSVLILCALVVGYFFVSVLSGCVSTELAVPSANETYRHDLKVKINGITFNGIGVAKAASRYEIEVYPPGKIDRIMWRTCNREEVVDAPDLGWMEKKYKFVIEPVQGLEDVTSCGLQITVLEEKKRRNGFAFIDFEDRRPEVSLPARLACNGVVNTVNGVSVCQSAVGLYQQINFDVPVIQNGSSLECDVMVPFNGDESVYRFTMPPGDCTYYFVAQEKALNGRRFVHRLNTKGYTDVPPIK